MPEVDEDIVMGLYQRFLSQVIKAKANHEDVFDLTNSFKKQIEEAIKNEDQ